MWKKGILTDEVKQKALKMIDGDFGLEVWAESGEKILRARKQVLEKFKQQLLSPQPAKKKIKPNTYILKVGGVFILLNIDEIYELFIWDTSYTDEEYEARVNKGIAEAVKLKNIYPFIQPIIIPAEKSKTVWEPCAMVVSEKSDAELKQYVYFLFEWLKDMNWPGAWTIFDRLLKMPFSEIEEKYSYCRKQAEREKDELWLMALDDFLKAVKNDFI